MATVGTKEAAALGMVDRVVEGDLLAAAQSEVAQTAKRRLSEVAVPASDAAEVEKAAGEALRSARGVPSVGKAVEMVRMAGGTPFAEAVRTERATFVALRDSAEAKALRHLFFAERNAQKVPGLAGAKARRGEETWNFVVCTLSVLATAGADTSATSDAATATDATRRAQRGTGRT